MHSVQAVVELHKQGGTVPFIARYRKEKTGNLDEVQIRDVLEMSDNFSELITRQAFIVKDGPSSIETGVRYKALQEFAGQAKEAYDKAKIDYVAGNSIAACAVTTPFYYRGQEPGFLNSNSNDYGR